MLKTPLFTQSWEDKGCIDTFTKGISTNWSANSLVLNLELDRQCISYEDNRYAMRILLVYF